MNEYSPKDELLMTLKGERIGYFPRCIPVFTPVVDMMKATGAFFPEANYQAAEMARLALAAHELGNWNSVMLPWASTVEMEALGCEVVNKEGDVTAYPQLKKRAFDDAYKVTFGDDILGRGSLPAVFDAIRFVRETIDKRYGGTIPVISMFQGPFTVGGYAIGVDEMFRHMIRDVPRVRKVLDVVSDLSILYGEKMLECGGDVVLMSDPAAEGLTGEQFRAILLPVYKKIAAAIQSKKMVHICGRTLPIASYIAESGFDGFSFDSSGVTLEALKDKTAGKIRLIGSVSTITHLLEGTRDEVVNLSLEMIRNGVDILSPSCGLPPHTPLANVKAIPEAIERWNREGG